VFDRGRGSDHDAEQNRDDAAGGVEIQRDQRRDERRENDRGDPKRVVQGEIGRGPILEPREVLEIAAGEVAPDLLTCGRRRDMHEASLLQEA
jgi:hypothetical protein